MSHESPIERLKRLQQAAQHAAQHATPPATQQPPVPVPPLVSPPAPLPTPAPPAFADEADYTRATEQLWKSYNVINEWIRFADVKAGALLTVDGVLLGALLGAAKDIRLPILQAHPWLWSPAMLGVGVVWGWVAWHLFLSARASFACIRPNIKSQSNADSIIFFGKIAAHPDVNAFEKSIVQHVAAKSAYEDIKHQVWNVARVAHTKHQNMIASIDELFKIAVPGAVLLLIYGLSVLLAPADAASPAPATSASTITAKPSATRPPRTIHQPATTPGIRLQPAPPRQGTP